MAYKQFAIEAVKIIELQVVIKLLLQFEQVELRLFELVSTMLSHWVPDNNHR